MPCASTLTETPLALVNSGNIAVNSPELSTEVVDAAPAGAVGIQMALPDGTPRFLPAAISANAGTVTFFLENVPGGRGRSPDHNMLIGPANVHFFPDGSVAADQVLAGTPHITAGQRAVFKVKDLAPGTYVFWCSIDLGPGGTHASEGMVGTLTITP